MITPFMPEEAILREVGRIVIRHGHVDHSLRNAIKRVLKVSIDDPILVKWTKGMTGNLHRNLRELIEQQLGDSDDAKMLYKVLDMAEELTASRNTLVHATWAHEKDASEPMLRDREALYKIPTIEELKLVEEKLEDVMRLLRGLTKKYLEQ